MTTLKCKNCRHVTTQAEADQRKFNTGKCAYCGGNLVTMAGKITKDQFIELAADLIEELQLQPHTPERKAVMQFSTALVLILAEYGVVEMEHDLPEPQMFVMSADALKILKDIEAGR